MTSGRWMLQWYFVRKGIGRCRWAADHHTHAGMALLMAMSPHMAKTKLRWMT